jgi:hypothetical protein
MCLDLEFSTALITRSNRIHDLAGHAGVDNSGQGIYQVGGAFSYVYGNLIYNVKQGMHLDGGGVFDPNYIYNNTIVNSTANGLFVNRSATQVNLVANNLVTGSALYGITDEGVTDQTLTTNLFYNNAGGNYNSIVAGGTDLTTDPLLTADYKLGAGSPARRAGTFWGAQCVDIVGRPCWNPPDIGGYQTDEPGKFHQLFMLLVAAPVVRICEWLMLVVSVMKYRARMVGLVVAGYRRAGAMAFTWYWRYKVKRWLKDAPIMLADHGTIIDVEGPCSMNSDALKSRDSPRRTCA